MVQSTNLINSWIGIIFAQKGGIIGVIQLMSKQLTMLEYNKSGMELLLSGRVPWSTVLTAEEAARYTVENV